jgi:signal recognition particle GTPase
MMKRLTTGNWTLRDMREQFQAVLKMGPLSNIMNQFPGETEGKGCWVAGREERRRP